MPPSTLGVTEMSPLQTGAFQTTQINPELPSLPVLCPRPLIDQSTVSLIYFILLGASVDCVLLQFLLYPWRSHAPLSIYSLIVCEWTHDVLLGWSPASMNVWHLDLLPSQGELVKGMANGKHPACSSASGCGKAAPLFLSALGFLS